MVLILTYRFRESFHWEEKESFGSYPHKKCCATYTQPSILTSVSCTMNSTRYVTWGYLSVRNGFAPDYIREVFNFVTDKGSSLRNADFDILRYSTVRFGKRSVRYLSPYLWSRLSPSSDRQRPSLVNFRWNVRKTWLPLLRARASIVTYVSLNHVCNGILTLFNEIIINSWIF